MRGISLKILTMLTMFYSLDNQADTTWIPISVGDITTFIPYTPTGTFAAPANVHISENNGISTISWGDVEHASQYEIQALNSAGQWVSILITDELSTIIDSRFSGYTSIRVMACTYNSCSSTGGWSGQINLNVEPNVERNVAQPLAPSLAAIPPIDALHDARIGLTPGSFKVDESGAAIYNIPVKLPAGIANVTPSLSLNYNSGSGNGSLGMGWNLSGLSAISRCRQTQEQDNDIGTISLSNDDRFCLNGQKLLAVSGNYGEPETEYRTEVDSQVRVISKGNSGDGPAYFTVERVDGSISYYGGQDISAARTDSLHLSANGTAFTWFIASTSDNFKNIDNSVFFYYNTEADGFGKNEVVIDKIEYSNNKIEFNYRSGLDRTDQAYGYMQGEKVEATALLDDIAVYNHFSTTSAIQSYHLTYENDAITNVYRVKEIQECNGIASGTCLPATVFDWHNQTSASSGAMAPNKSLDLGSDTLKVSVPFDLDGDGFNDLAYIVETRGHYDLYISYNNQGTLQPPSRLDSFSLNNGVQPSITPLDIDGDSKMEIIYPRGSASLNRWVSYDLDDAIISTIQDDRTGIDRTTTNYIKYLGPNISQTGTDVMFNDIDADGDADMVYRHNGTNYIVKNSYGDFGSAVPVNISMTGVRYSSSSIGSLSVSSLVSHLPPTDFNGDGRADAIFRIRGQAQVGCGVQSYYFLAAFELVENNGTYSYQLVENIADSYSNSASTEHGGLFTSDINSDGLSDILHKSSSEYKLLLATGAGFADSVINIALKDSNGVTVNNDDIQSMQFVDVNKDGQADILYFNKKDAEWRVHHQQATVFGASELLFEESNFDSNTDSTLVGDWNGDGRLDTAKIDYSSKTFYYRSNSDWYFTGHYPNFERQWTNQPGNRIHTITNGFGLKTYIEYDLLTNDEFYTKADNAEDLTDYGNGSPIYDIISPSYLVSTVTSDAPGYNTSTNLYESNNQVSVSYKYQGLRVQAGGRGSLGFEKLTSYDHQTNVTTDTVYQQNFPYIGMPKATLSYFGEPQLNALNINGTTSVATSQRIKYAINSYGEKWLESSTIVFPYLDVSTEYQYSLNDAGTATAKIAQVNTDHTYQVYSDNHANLQTIAVTTKNSYNTTLSTVTTTNTYADENVSNWWLGRVSNTSVTHNRPSAHPVAQRVITRNSSFEYHGTSGMLSLETVNLGGSEALSTLHCYDTKGNEIKTIAYANVGSVSCSSAHIETESAGTNGLNNRVFRRALTTYDANGRYVISKGNDKFAALSTINSRNNRGQVTRTTDINGVVTNIGYDDFGNQYYTGNSLGQWSKKTLHNYLDFSWSGTSTLLYTQYTTSSDKPRVTSHFNTSGLAVSTEKVGFDGTIVKQSVIYDAYGRAVKQSMPYYTGATQYWNITYFDVFGRVQSSDTAAGTANGTSNTVVYNGLTVTTTVNTNDSHNVSQSRIETKSVLGESTSVQDAAGIIQFKYNAVGNLTKVIGVDNTIIETTYDNYGRKIAMNDPDKGNWSYSYNNLGELISQTSANGFITKFYRDSIGRTVLRAVTGNNVTDYTDYSYFASHLLQSESDGNQIKQYFYDAFGRVDIVRTTFDNVTYSQQVTYDEKGRLFQSFEADSSSLQGCVNNSSAVGNCWGVQNHYNTYGYLEKQLESRNGASANAKVYYQVTAMDALGNVTHFNQSDNLTSSIKGFNQANGFISTINTQSNGIAIQSNAYTFDGLGNLRSRENDTLKTGTLGQLETFDYDDINRLTDINDVEKVRYAANGNILWKYDVGNYCYNSARPHAVSGIGSAGCTTQSYQYDPNGNMTSGRGRTIDYSHFDKPVNINNNEGSTQFTYGTDRKRFKRVTTEEVDGIDVTTTTYYLGSVEVVSKSNSSVITTRRNLPGAIELRRSNGTREISYLHKDHLGSIDTISDANGDIKQKLYFDAWGKKQVINTGNYVANLGSFNTITLTQLLDITPRGFTGHESVDHADIIHMNGRIYDPTLGRFLQADPLIQAPDNSQSYNRYSYVFNNPLKYTDPSGYSAWTNFRDKVLKPFAGVIVGLALGMVCGPNCAYGAMIAIGGFAGATSAAVNGGNIGRGALIGAFSAAAFGAIGQNYLPGTTENIFGNALVGGILSDLQGGNFGHGFLAAGFAAAAKPAIYDKFGYSPDNAGARVVTAAVIGGTASVISGGKFTNGAVTAAFSQMFNGESYAKRKWGEIQKFASFMADRVMSGQVRDDIFDYGKNVFGFVEGLAKGGASVFRGVYRAGYQGRREFDNNPIVQEHILIENKAFSLAADVYWNDDVIRGQVNSAVVNHMLSSTNNFGFVIGRTITGVVTGGGLIALPGDIMHAGDQGVSTAEGFARSIAFGNK
ncbi:RHS repeat-associated core domain-containing protein [Colwellia sp. MB02u-14]|uniref:RHS repeat-associated core domain-containing protein n=1 Tax=Colwellia sp. MB02u-14 TaxID=2759815 RepID=UPI0015F4991D|nr:RHS repeat-associated core domain-containing protein [Colwellia sp. MB02u-14]MBA6302857.1 VCBS repeat-containing protein [Colwellia sp. MB02u-14]